ncbi:MAG: hypothetical protein EOO09_09650 [Chitinophagaceae bacterium]|nr:MAG: hypothetical protein EOO09_09650 [Chitinophagaceae bacterium]
MASTEEFELPVTFLGEERMLPASFSTRGYIHRISIAIDGVLVHFEPDEERNYRAILDEPLGKTNVSQGLVQAVVESLEKLFKNG